MRAARRRLLPRKVFSDKGASRFRRRRSARIWAVVEEPVTTTVRDHNGRVCRFSGWVAAPGEPDPVIRVLGPGGPQEFTPTIERSDVIASLADPRLTDSTVGFELYVRLPGFEAERLPVALEFAAGDAVARSSTYRLVRDVDPLAAATYFGNSAAKRRLARAELSGRGLEFGALHLPLDVDPQRCEMHYADRWTKPEALEMFPELRRSYAERMVEPGVIVDVALDDLTQIDGERFDFFVANDVIEHLPDPIGFLANVARQMKPGARLFISVPDREFSFDVMRNLTPFEHLWSEHLDGVREVTDEHVVEFLTGTGVDVPNDADARRTLIEMHRARSIHVHVWDQESFDAFLDEVIDRLELGLRTVSRLRSGEAGGSMVYVLEKG